MDFKINPMVYTSMFPIPTSIIDENIKLASPSQLKTILYFFRLATTGEVPTASKIASAIGYDVEDCEDALIFWSERGLLIKGEITEATQIIDTKASNTKETKTCENTDEKNIEDIPIVKPSFEQVRQRLEESADIQVLFRETDSILGKTTGFSGQSTLLMLHDNYGLPIEVILTLIQYSKSIGRTGMTQISSLAKKWYEKEIITLESAEEYIATQNRVSEIWKEFRALSYVRNEIPTTKQREYFDKWSKEFKMSAIMIFRAYELSIERTEKFSLGYMNKVLNNWHLENVHTEKELDELNKQKSKSNKNASNKTDTTPSYNIDEFANIGLKVD